MVSLLLLIYLSSCFTFSHQLKCPSCSADCGDVGYITCDGCQCAPSCDVWPCTPPYECVLETKSCYSSPCPKIPNCVDLSSICIKGSPLATEESTILCDPYEVKCPLGFSCTKVMFHNLSVCCTASSDDGPPPMILPFPPHLTTTSSNDNEEGCVDCMIDGCEETTCRAHPTAQCVSGGCSCEWWYVDENGELVDCLPDDDVAPPPFLFPDFDLDSFSPPPYKSSPKMDPISPHGVNQGPKTETVTPNNRGSHNDHQGNDDVTVHVIIGCIVAVLVILIALLSCKLYLSRKRKPPSEDEEDQRKPLQVSNGEKPVA